ncbi:MAG: FKBP-type peptidyl-prolyl cis-trans isomerase [Bacteroidales bacterium]|nr:FKBP-type peptidyl-prolyl cis-trans isomerase [Bacteroidales bacterium]
MKKLIYLALVLFLGACSGKKTLEQTTSGLKYQMIIKSESEQKVQINDIASLSMKYYLVSNDSLLFSTIEAKREFKIQAKENNFEGGSFEEGILLLSEGDSIHFFVNAKNLFDKTMHRPVPAFVTETDEVRFEIKLISVQSMEDIEKEQKAIAEENKNKELDLMNEYIANNNITEKPTSSGLYIIYKNKGNGAKTVEGKKVSVHYTGTYINGEKFDSSVDRNEPFEFVLGAKQVIPAWDETVAQLSVGDKVDIIAPSSIAYGERGHQAGIPPYSTLLFEIEVLSIEK